MILKGNQRGGAAKLARHLLRTDENEHVTVHELRGFSAEDLTDALREIEAVSKGTRCRQYLFSLSLNPPETAEAKVEDFEAAITDIEQKLGLEGQPRAVVFHEKEGRRHAHCVWSRIDTNSMTALNLAFYKRKLADVSRGLYLEHGWEIPDGLRDRSLRDPLNFTRAEWQQAKRAKLDPRELKSLFKAAWESSDTRTTFEHALREKGFWLARGDRRGFVAIDYRGEIYAVAKWTGARAKEVKARLGDPAALSSVDQVKARIAERMTGTLSKFIKEIEGETRKRSATLEFRRGEMAGRHREERQQLETALAKRWTAETNARAARLPKGMKGIWHRITGRYAEIRKQNEHDTWTAQLRDRAEKDALVLEQLEERRALQIEIREQRSQQQDELLQLRADVARYQAMQERTPSPDNDRVHDRDRKRSRDRQRTPKP
ncbi:MULTISPECIES: relaxase/mobilization nuclease domain-containing protein [unclassified Mameliella]|uniref:relaxase/mobilization nuclease domain-containing protein n=1 Tax=unclassified Mameliella TaxID=2630630 RepID=UPI00273ED7AE|nr:MULTISPECIES: relaxase/mobilization nuclease domain-containing protein [unclassified Mameliella]